MMTHAAILTVVDAHPLTEVLTSMPGIGVRTAARILTEVVGKNFKSVAHLASYAGIAPVTRRSGTSIRGEAPSRRALATETPVRSGCYSVDPWLVGVCLRLTGGSVANGSCVWDGGPQVGKINPRWPDVLQPDHRGIPIIR